LGCAHPFLDGFKSRFVIGRDGCFLSHDLADLF
jgi:hypothetical protein